MQASFLPTYICQFMIVFSDFPLSLLRVFHHHSRSTHLDHSTLESSLRMAMLHQLKEELISSIEIVFASNKLNWLLLFGPVAIFGNAMNFGEAACFFFAGFALIPCAERYVRNFAKKS